MEYAQVTLKKVLSYYWNSVITNKMFEFNMQDTLKRWLCPALCINTLTILKIRKYGKLIAVPDGFWNFYLSTGSIQVCCCIAYILGLNLPIYQLILVFKTTNLFARFWRKNELEFSSPKREMLSSLSNNMSASAAKWQLDTECSCSC